MSPGIRCRFSVYERVVAVDCSGFWGEHGMFLSFGCGHLWVALLVNIASLHVVPTVQDSGISAPSTGITGQSAAQQSVPSGLDITGYVSNTTQTFTATQAESCIATGSSGNRIIAGVPVDGVVVGVNLTPQGIPNAIRMVRSLTVQVATPHAPVCLSTWHAMSA
jgi:hypothetical protein